MAGQESIWSSGIENISLKLVRAEGDKNTEFTPSFIYPIFGDAETIFGYQNLKVNLSFTSGALNSLLDISYDSKIAPTSTVEADDIEGLLYKWLPTTYTQDKGAFQQLVQTDAQTFRPFGTRIASFAQRRTETAFDHASNAETLRTGEIRWQDCDADDEDAKLFEAWHSPVATPGFRDYLRRVQLFIPLFIEAGEFVDEEDEGWDFVCLYENSKSVEGQQEYHFVGFTSLFNFLHWPDRTRIRLAQFVILPPFGRRGLGTRFYSLVYIWLLSRPEVAELTVEDPSESFQDLRDKADLNALLSKDVLKGIQAPVDKAWAFSLRQEMKLAERQFGRLLEMVLLLHSKPDKAYRLFVKGRLFRFNYDVLSQATREERHELLRTTYEALLDDYRRIVAPFRTHSFHAMT